MEETLLAGIPKSKKGGNMVDFWFKPESFAITLKNNQELFGLLKESARIALSGYNQDMVKNVAAMKGNNFLEKVKAISSIIDTDEFRLHVVEVINKEIEESVEAGGLDVTYLASETADDRFDFERLQESRVQGIADVFSKMYQLDDLGRDVTEHYLKISAYVTVLLKMYTKLILNPEAFLNSISRDGKVKGNKKEVKVYLELYKSMLRLSKENSCGNRMAYTSSLYEIIPTFKTLSQFDIPDTVYKSICLRLEQCLIESNDLEQIKNITVTPEKIDLLKVALFIIDKHFKIVEDVTNLNVLSALNPEEDAYSLDNNVLKLIKPITLTDYICSNGVTSEEENLLYDKFLDFCSYTKYFGIRRSADLDILVTLIAKIRNNEQYTGVIRNSISEQEFEMLTKLADAYYPCGLDDPNAIELLGNYYVKSCERVAENTRFCFENFEIEADSVSVEENITGGKIMNTNTETMERNEAAGRTAENTNTTKGDNMEINLKNLKSEDFERLDEFYGFDKGFFENFYKEFGETEWKILIEGLEEKRIEFEGKLIENFQEMEEKDKSLWQSYTELPFWQQALIAAGAAGAVGGIGYLIYRCFFTEKEEDQWSEVQLLNS